MYNVNLLQGGVLPSVDAPNTRAQSSVHPKDTVQAGGVSVPTSNQDLVGPNQRSLNSRALGAEKQDWVSTNKQTKIWIF